MQPDEVIPATEFCVHHNIQLSFIYSLADHGLMDLVLVNEQPYLPLDKIGTLEKILHLHYEMDINLEGIETISYLLQKMHAMHEELIELNNKLKFYEEIEGD